MSGWRLDAENLGTYSCADPKRLQNYFEATVELIAVLARACGHSSLRCFSRDDLTTFHREMADLSGIPYGGVA